jgi:hypothetical protein
MLAISVRCVQSEPEAQVSSAALVSSAPFFDGHGCPWRVSFADVNQKFLKIPGAKHLGNR